MSDLTTFTHFLSKLALKIEKEEILTQSFLNLEDIFDSKNLGNKFKTVKRILNITVFRMQKKNS